MTIKKTTSVFLLLSNYSKFSSISLAFKVERKSFILEVCSFNREYFFSQRFWTFFGVFRLISSRYYYLLHHKMTLLADVVKHFGLNGWPTNLVSLF